MEKEESKIDKKDFVIVLQFSSWKRKNLGEGAHGVVFFGFDQNTGERFVAKLNTDESDTAINREIQSLSEIGNHPNILEIKDSFVDQRGKFVLFQMLQCNLNELSKFNPPFQQETLMLMAVDIIEGLRHVHQKGWCHRDLNNQNIMITMPDKEKNMRMQIIDFGNSKLQVGKDKKFTDSESGTKWYHPPEYTKGVHNAEQIDIYSLGINLVELMIGQHPYLLVTRGERITQSQFKKVFNFEQEVQEEKIKKLLIWYEDQYRKFNIVEMDMEQLKILREQTRQCVKIIQDLQPNFWTLMKLKRIAKFQFNNQFSEEFKAFLFALINPEVDKRYDFEQIYKSPYFNQYLEMRQKGKVLQDKKIRVSEKQVFIQVHDMARNASNPDKPQEQEDIETVFDLQPCEMVLPSDMKFQNETIDIHQAILRVKIENFTVQEVVQQNDKQDLLEIDFSLFKDQSQENLKKKQIKSVLFKEKKHQEELAMESEEDDDAQSPLIIEIQKFMIKPKNDSVTPKTLLRFTSKNSLNSYERLEFFEEKVEEIKEQIKIQLQTVLIEQKVQSTL